MSHIAIKLNDSYLATGEDTELDLEYANPYFNEQSEVMTHPFTVPFEGNRKHFGNIDTPDSDENLSQVEGSVMGVEVDGILMASGKTGNIENQVLSEGTIGLQMVSAVHTLDEYLDGVRCRDVELKDKILIGETIGNLRVSYNCDLTLYMITKVGVESWSGDIDDTPFKRKLFSESIQRDDELTVQLPALGFSVPAICKNIGGSADYLDKSPYYSDGNIGVPPTRTASFINVTDAYDPGNGHYYCNSRVCYMHYKKDENGESSDEVDTSTTDKSEYGIYNPYLMLEADRPASGLCFYVLYFLDCLFDRFKQDGIAYDNSDLLAVQDLKRLAFFTTHCKFYTELRPSVIQPALRNLSQVNKWLNSRNIDTKFSFETNSGKAIDLKTITIDGEEYRVGDEAPWPYGRQIEDKYVLDKISRIYARAENFSTPQITADVMNMYANSQNFPDADAKTVIDSLWASFGIRFFLDQETRTVKPRFIRDIFRDNSAPIVFPCVVLSASRMTEKNTGFRMKYSGESDDQTKKDNITLGQRDYDTTYDYQDYRNLDISRTYEHIITQAYDTNMTLYVDLTTGNMYRVKIDSEAEDRNKYHPVIFEVGQLTGVAIGDCSSENEDYVTEVVSSFQPVVFNDINFRYERSSAGEYDRTYTMDVEGTLRQVKLPSDGSREQVLAAFINEEMWHENIERRLTYSFGSGYVQVDLIANIKTAEAYDVSSSDDGDSPLQSLDWGLSVAMMRGGGKDAYVDYYDYDYDMFGNCKYRMVAGGGYTLSLDSIDAYSAVYDYNGTNPGVGDDGVTITKEQAKSSILAVYSHSNADLLSTWRKVSGAEAKRKGWDVNPDDYCTYISGSRGLKDADGFIKEFLYVAISDMGTIYTPAEIDSYLQLLEVRARVTGRDIMSLDAETNQDIIIAEGGIGRHLLVESYSTSDIANQYAVLLHQLGDVVYGDSSTLTCPIPVGAPVQYDSIMSDRFSLKIRSYIPAPYDITDVSSGKTYQKGTPLCNPAVARRGLFDTFMSEYAHFILNRKRIQLEVSCEAAALTHIQWHRRYQFGHYVGWIDKIRSHMTAKQGIESVTIELLVL